MSIRKTFEIMDIVCTIALGVVSVYFVGRKIYKYGFQDGCDATLTANQLI